MISRTEKEVRNKVESIWPNIYPTSIESIGVHPDFVEVSFKGNLTFSNMMDLAEFFGTKNIDTESNHTGGGCETCDYGNYSYITLYIRPEVK